MDRIPLRNPLLELDFATERLDTPLHHEQADAGPVGDASGRRPREQRVDFGLVDSRIGVLDTDVDPPRVG